MKTFMRYIIIAVALCLGLASCDTKQNWWDSGISSPYHDCSIMDYLRSDTANWGLTVVLIERAGLTPLFEGKDENYPEITFFAPPSFSILRHVWDEASGKDTGNQRPLTEEEKNHPERLVQALDPDWCREMVMRHVVKGKYLKADIAYRDPSYDIFAEEQTGGTDFTCETGNRVRAFRDKSAYGGVPDAGPETLYLYSFDAMQMVPLASPDIQPLNGVVHALNYNYVLGRI